MISQVLAIADLADQIDNRAADNDGVGQASNCRSLFGIGNAKTDRNWQTSMLSD